MAEPWISNRAKNMREYLFKEILAGLCVGHTRPQRKSYAMSVMDKVEGWENKNGWVRDLRHAFGSTLMPYCVIDRNPRRNT